MQGFRLFRVWVWGLALLGGVTAPAFAMDSPGVPAPYEASASVQDAESVEVLEGSVEQQLSIRVLDELCLVYSYPDVVAGLASDDEGAVWLMLRDGRRVLYADNTPVRYANDGVPENATVSQSMAELYPLPFVRSIPLQGNNPGRARSTAFMAELYGSERGEQQLVPVRVGTEQIRITSRQGMDEAFQRVAEGLEDLATDPAMRKYIFPFGGGFSWRTINGTTRLSPHSYGIAIDLNPARGGYWRWKRSRPDYSRYPQAVVELFENNGFIWGGKWNKFDLMHFEYRPELLCKARLLGGQAQKWTSQ